MKQRFDLDDIAWNFKQQDYLTDENSKIYESTVNNTDPHFIQQHSMLLRWLQLSVYRVVMKEPSKIKCIKESRAKKSVLSKAQKTAAKK